MEKSSRLSVVRDLLFFGLLIFLLVLFWKNNFLATIILLSSYLIRSYFWHEKADHVFYITGAVLGTTAEIISTHAGIWRYTLPTFLNIPLWLPFAWGFAAVLILRIAQNFADS